MIFLQLASALIIATVVYRWQKDIDRETALLAEFRRLCAEYIKATRTAYFEQPFVGDEHDTGKLKSFFSISPAEQSAYITRDQLYLVAPDHIVDLIEDHDRAFRAWKNGFPQLTTGEPAPEQAKAELRRLTDDLLASHKKMLEGMRASQRLLGKRVPILGRVQMLKGKFQNALRLKKG